MTAKVSIAISTFGARVNQLSLPSPIESIKYMIVHQAASGVKLSNNTIELLRRKDVAYYAISSIGLSKSRNFALTQAQTQYIHIMDDDVSINAAEILNLCSTAQEHDIDIAIGHFEYENGRVSKGRNAHRNTVRTSFSVCSIELCIKTSAVSNKITFDENFGLGTKYPSGEEFIFLMDCRGKKLRISHYPICIGRHPDITSGEDFYSSDDKILAKRKMLERALGRRSLPYKIIFLVKKTPILIKKSKFFHFLKLFLLSSTVREPSR